MAGSLSWKRLAGAVACLVGAGGFGTFAPALAVGALLLAILVAVIAAEHVSEARRRAHGAPSPLERVEASA